MRTDTLRDQLQASLGDAYGIERELGGGGMSRVFLAEDRALRRRVVVKVLSPELSADVSCERFSREIMLAASLQQANIVPLLATGDSNGLPYYTMPFVEGESLRHRLDSVGRPLAIREVVNILRDVARALDYAHERGVVHRDIKPENILLSGQAAVVTDFGIAKAIAASREHEPELRLTTEGTVIGTPRYVSPEQASGSLEIDHRADLYAFGCLAFELLTGQPPFTGTHQHVFAAHVNEPPPKVETIRRNTPAWLARLIARCLNKDPNDRPQSAREVLKAFDEPRGPSARTTRIVGFVSAAVMILAIVAAMTFRSRARVGGDDALPRTLAVMPFTIIGDDSAQEYFADGIATDLTTALGKVPGLSVASRSLSFAFKGKTIDARDVGKQLGVDALVEATVWHVGERLRITTQLTRTSDGFLIWANTYERDAKDVFGVQSSIAKAIVDELRPKLATRTQTTTNGGDVAGTTDFEAYNAFLRGAFLLEHRGPGVVSSIDYFKQAIARDSTFARAYGMLSEALELLPYFTPTRADAVEREAIAAARTALRLDSTVVDAHIGLALALDHEFKWEDAEKEYRTAVALNPSYPTAHVQYGRHLMNRGFLDKSLEEFRAAVAADPISGTALMHLSHAMSQLGRHDSAMIVSRRAREVDPALILSRTMGARDALAAGDTTLARSLASGIEAPPPWRGQAAFVLGKVGDTASARAMLRELDKLPRNTWMIHTGTMYTALGLGDTARALAELEAAYYAGEIVPKWETFADRMFDAVRGNSRFTTIVRAFKLDPRAFGASSS